MQPIRVMLVDDSAVVRGLMNRALSQDTGIRIVASASDGGMAVQALRREPADVILLDIEMPGMDGLTALPKLLEVAPRARVIIASSMSEKGAEISLRAMQLGAVDCIPKPTAGSDPAATQKFYQEVIGKIKGLRRAGGDAAPPPVTSPKTLAAPVKALAVAASTGGPQALLELFSKLRGQLLEVPIFITQHMPPMFTSILAEHLARSSQKPCHEAKQGETVMPGAIYVAPGDYHMRVERRDSRVVLAVNQDPPVHFCRPAADPMFASIAKIYGKQTLAVVLTGMGHDGLDGARAIVEAGGSVIAQDQASSVVWGMPRAIVEHKLCRLVLPLKYMAERIALACEQGRL